MSLHDLKSKALSQLPVIGPHGEFEGELLLKGTKPLGWISLMPPGADERHPSISKRLDVQRRLDQAVKAGRLKSADVVQRFVMTPPPGVPLPPWLSERLREGPIPDRENLSRHYCQPGRERDLKVMTAFNQAALNRREPAVQLEKSLGEYLGYRARDEKLWAFINRHHSPAVRPLIQAFLEFSHRYAKPALEEQLLKGTQDPAAKNLPTAGELPKDRPRSPGEPPPWADAGSPFVQVELGVSSWLARDYGKALGWFSKAANQGDSIAQHNIGVMYENGNGVAQDYAAAYFWKSLAAKSPLRLYTQAEADETAGHLTAAQKTDIDNRLAAASSTHPSPALFSLPATGSAAYDPTRYAPKLPKS